MTPSFNNTYAEKGEVLNVTWYVTECFGGSLWREGGLRAVCVGGLDSLFCWLALARRQFTGRVCWWELSRSVTVARFSEKAVYGPYVLLRA